MRHLKRFNESFNDLLVDPMGFGINDIKQNAVFLDKDDNWGYDNEYMIYFGPCEDEDSLSDSISFTDEFIESNLNSVGITNYRLHCSENAHLVYFDNREDADTKFTALVGKLQNDGYQIKN